MSVALLDRDEFPRDKVCGDVLGPGVSGILADLGDDDLLDGYEPVDRVTVVGPAGSSVSTLLSGKDGLPGAGYVIPRIVFDERLVHRAVDAGAILLTKRRFTGLVQQQTHVEIDILEKDGGKRTMSARYVVGADGAASRVRRAVAEPRNDDKHTASAIRAYAHCEYSSQNARRSLFLKFSEPYLPAYGWVFPMNDQTVSIGLGVGVDQLKSRRLDLRALLRRFAEDLEIHGYRVGELGNQGTHILPLASHLPRLAHGRVALIGDAGSMVNPTSGEGIFYGMEAGRMLARHLSETTGEDADLSVWEERYRERFSSHFNSSARVRRLLRKRFWPKIMFAAAGRDPAVVDEGVSILFAEGTISASGTVRVIEAAVNGFLHPNKGDGALRKDAPNRWMALRTETGEPTIREGGHAGSLTEPR